MNSSNIELFAFAFLVIITGILFLIALVKELAPNERRQWLLGIGFGAGVIAFSLKIGLVVLFSSYPEPIFALLPSKDISNEKPLALAESFVSNPFDQPSYEWLALPNTAPYPASNPPSDDKIALGKKLFFDKRLSADNSLSCASCHEISDAKGGADGLAGSLGIDNQIGGRNAPTVLNSAFQRVLFWDGRASSLEEQAKGPLVNPIEMGMPSHTAVEEKLKGLDGYNKDFAKAFPDQPQITINNIAKAIASFERTLITPDSPYDRFVKGDTQAMTIQQIRGMALFEQLGCVQCHSGPNFSGASTFDSGSPYRIFPLVQDSDFEKHHQLTQDLGVLKPEQATRGLWRVPSLRNVSRTAPYFHNGSVDSLEEAVRVMVNLQLGKKLSNDHSADKKVRWLTSNSEFSISENQAVSDTEIKEIVAFLEALSGKLPNIY